MWNTPGVRAPLFALLLALSACGARDGLQGPDRATNCDSCPLAVTSHLALGSEHTCVLARESVFCWGTNRRGELGDGTTTDHVTPMRVPQLDAVVGLAASRAFSIPSGGSRGSRTCAWLVDGSVRCWGANVGLTDTAQGTPSTVDGFVRALQVSTSYWHTCELQASGAVLCLGDTRVPTPGPALVRLSSATSVTTGANFTCAARTDGSGWCWGDGSTGNLGGGFDISYQDSPQPVIGLSSVIQISSRHLHTCAVLRDGSVSCWGENFLGQLGDGTVVPRWTPVKVQGLVDAVSVSTGSNHTCAVRRSGRVMCWGDPSSVGALPSTPRKPVDVANLENALEVAAGDGGTCARLRDESVWCWGSLSGGLGDGTTTESALPVRVALP